VSKDLRTKGGGKMIKNKGFTMIELLVVLVIIGILAAVVTPIYVQNTNKAKASEAIATMGLIRQAMREQQIKSNTFFDVKKGDLNNSPDDTTGRGLDINVGTAQYFSNDAFTVIASDTQEASTRFSNPPVVDFLIRADGNESIKCTGNVTDCAIRREDIKDYRLEMDNSGRIYVSYNAGTDWVEY